MNRLVIIGFAASVALNVFLLIAQKRNTATPLERLPTAKTKAADGFQLPDNGVDGRQSTESPPEKTYPRFDWSSVESDDYRTYMENLRSIGCPPETIRDIVAQDLKKSYRAKEWEILRKSISTQYWSSSFKIGTELGQQQMADLRELSEYFTKSHRELLGTEPHEQLLSVNTPEIVLLAQYGDMDFGTVQKLVPIQTRLYAELLTTINEEDDLRKNSIVKKAQDEIAANLSPEQRITFELRTSRLAKGLREIQAFNSESDFRDAFFSLRDTIEAETQSNPVSDQEYLLLLKNKLGID